MRIDLLSLFPGYFESPLRMSILGRAIEQGKIEVVCRNIPVFADGKQKKVDDRPYGGGTGMVLMPGPVVRAVRASQIEGVSPHVVYLSPQGEPLTAGLAEELAQYPHLILLCGHYEGVDQRAIDEVVDREVSIGDYVLTNGCLA